MKLRPAMLPLVSALLSLAAISHLTVPTTGSLFGVSALDINADRMALERRYTTPHSLGDNYVFDPRDGWQTVNTTNLLYKYQRRTITKHIGYDTEPDDDDDADSGDSLLDSDASKEVRGYTHGTRGVNLSPPAINSTPRMKLVRRARISQSSSKAHKAQSKSKSTTKPKPKKPPTTQKDSKKDVINASSTQTGLLSSFRKVFQSIKPIGNPEPVTITWSFAAALTLAGWESKPECFKFLERCAEGSKHVDLTKAAFTKLADLDEGLLTVQMRQATDPMDGWLEELWGPKMAENK
ncbi:hypothetical protein GSI_00937 [Ganoderma sinense ZZ0214-1]|uniref:Uncharacterized protein n=1 Tax=Ganoderma sinense ZZ0214-1 TaxID=1077348 RepID=A0A2G8SU17_9APHY|nr:hypothetical protein GSI_00937 [Ganoderma sinense ZZ0214-1]